MKNESKRTLYLSLWIVTGLLLGILFGGLIEYEYLILDVTVLSKVFIYTSAILTGIVFGFWIGPKAWKKIYVDGARGQKYISK